MIDPRITAINEMRGTELTTPGRKTDEKAESSFGETLKRYINDANDLQISADRDVQRVIAGEDIDAHEVMTAVEKASISFEMVMEIRNKMMEAYREVMRAGN